MKDRIFARRMARPLTENEIESVAAGYPDRESPGVGRDWDTQPSNPYVDGYMPFPGEV